MSNERLEKAVREARKLSKLRETAEQELNHIGQYGSYYGEYAKLAADHGDTIARALIEAYERIAALELNNLQRYPHRGRCQRKTGLPDHQPRPRQTPVTNQWDGKP